MRRALWCVVLLLLLRLGWSVWGWCKEFFKEEAEPEKKAFVMPKDSPLRGSLPFWQVDSSKVAIALYDITADEMVYELHADRLMAPASCMKLLTAITALKRLGTDAHYVSRLLCHGTIHRGTLYGSLIFEGDDDPLFESFEPMVNALKQRGIQRIVGDVVLDLARNDTLRPHSTASAWDILYGKLPLLLKGENFVRRQLLYTLSLAGIKMERSGVVRKGDFSSPFMRRAWLNAIESGATLIAAERHSLREVIAPMLIHSSNIKAESVLWHTDNMFYRWGAAHVSSAQLPASSLKTFIREEMPEEDTAGFVINDGSGLSPANRLTARFLAHLMVYAWHDDEIRHVLIDEALATPQGGVRRGSLINRMSAPKFKNRVFCKTGTLTTIGSSSLSGYIHSENGHWYAFSIINEDTPVYDGRQFQDRICRIVIEAR